jgi:hypothetical protein
MPKIWGRWAKEVTIIPLAPIAAKTITIDTCLMDLPPGRSERDEGEEGKQRV